MLYSVHSIAFRQHMATEFRLISVWKCNDIRRLFRIALKSSYIHLARTRTRVALTNRSRDLTNSIRLHSLRRPGHHARSGHNLIPPVPRLGSKSSPRIPDSFQLLSVYRVQETANVDPGFRHVSRKTRSCFTFFDPQATRQLAPSLGGPRIRIMEVVCQNFNE